ncbi:hypothetical protein AB0758_44895 [Tolypothrix bouteillei VB521301_2]|uniref:hypothetical protein n=1 Tax=Tolypothrix bouteillei TaxID=1246981 RepID=UPI0038B66AED
MWKDLKIPILTAMVHSRPYPRFYLWTGNVKEFGQKRVSREKLYQPEEKAINKLGRVHPLKIEVGNVKYTPKRLARLASNLSRSGNPMKI